MPNIEIVSFTDDWAGDFASLNYEWIEEYFAVEKHDKEVLDDPQTNVIEPGGEIYMAVVSGLAAGTVALIPAGEGILELTKMAVSPEFRGMGIGDALMARCIEHARISGVQTIWMESHTKLAPALGLYRKHGFVETPKDPNSLYSRADIRMQLAI